MLQPERDYSSKTPLPTGTIHDEPDLGIHVAMPLPNRLGKARPTRSQVLSVESIKRMRPPLTRKRFLKYLFSK